MKKYTAIAIVFVAICGPAWADPPDPPLELVLREDARLEIRTGGGVVAVIAGKKFARRYEWANCGLNSRMSARRVRWLGSFGIYDGAPQWPGAGILAPSCQGVTRTVVGEGQIHFLDRRPARPTAKARAGTAPGSTTPSRARPRLSGWNTGARPTRGDRARRGIETGAVGARQRAARN